MNIILIGPPGSGKSTQGDLLSKKLKLPYFSVGRILRKIAEDKSEKAEKLKKYMDAGNLLPDNIIMPIIEDHIKHEDHQNGFIMDGFPRHLDQAEGFSQPVDKVIYIDLPDKEALWRIAKRTDKRHDQSAATILHRLEVFHRDTDKVRAYYEKQGKLIKVDGMPSIEKIHASIVKALS